MVLHPFGKGKVLYASGTLEGGELYCEIFVNLIRLLVNGFSFESEAPKSVEMTAFLQENNHRFLINLANFQDPLPIFQPMELG